jgi:tagatose 6-phosphate kinase
VLAGFVGEQNGRWIIAGLRHSGIHVAAVKGYSGESRTCTIVCDTQSGDHPTVINEESPPVEPGAAAKLLKMVDRWIPRVSAVLATGSLSQGLPADFYAEIVDRARIHGKITAIDASGAALRAGLTARPTFTKPNGDEFEQLTNGSDLSLIADHTAVTFGRAGAALIHGGRCLLSRPPRISNINPVGAGDAFTAGYLYKLLRGAAVEECFRSAMAAASADCATARPGDVAGCDIERLSAEVELRCP